MGLTELIGMVTSKLERASAHNEPQLVLDAMDDVKDCYDAQKLEHPEIKPADFFAEPGQTFTVLEWFLDTYAVVDLYRVLKPSDQLLLRKLIDLFFAEEDKTSVRNLIKIIFR